MSGDEGERKDKIVAEGRRSIEEFDKAWEEFFGGKTRPRNDEEDERQQQEFAHWYNNVRKQSDTGKTPAEMGERIMEFHSDDDKAVWLNRPCPECSRWGLLVTEDVNTYECRVCGSIWKRLKPLNDGTGEMINMPRKLKKLLDEAGAHENVDRKPRRRE